MAILVLSRRRPGGTAGGLYRTEILVHTRGKVFAALIGAALIAPVTAVHADPPDREDGTIAGFTGNCDGETVFYQGEVKYSTRQNEDGSRTFHEVSRAEGTDPSGDEYIFIRNERVTQPSDSPFVTDSNRRWRLISKGPEENFILNNRTRDGETTQFSAECRG